MLVPAQLYRDELRQELIKRWYDPKYQFYFGDNRSEFEIPDNTEWRRDFVHLNSKGEVDGFFSYNYNECSKSLCNFGLVGFNDNNTAFLRDVIANIIEIFKQGAQRMEFFAYTDNPAVNMYDKVIERLGGRKVGVLHRTAFFNGKYHDSVIYEILREYVDFSEVRNG